MEAESSTAAQVTRKSRSNLAFALRCLPRAKRRDMTTFYAFCRQIDDLADEPTAPKDERLAKLERWKTVIWARTAPVTPVEQGVLELMSRYPVSPGLLEEIILGMEMDLQGESYVTYADLESYCFRVASAVGLVSIEIFGYSQVRAKDYAIELGHALQMTNILRDVREDYLRERRIYLPTEDLLLHGVSPPDLGERKESENFLRLMRFEADRVKARYDRATELLPVEDRAALRAIELMRRIYQALFYKMERDGFRVLSRRYRLSGWDKLFLLLETVFGYEEKRWASTNRLAEKAE
jgi:15-cis-phytoene synthase